MGGFGLPIPGQGRGGYGPRPGPQGGVYGQPNDLVSSKTPFMNTLVDSINSFVGGFQENKNKEKEAAMQRFQAAMQAQSMGIPIDMKRAARDARTAGLNFDFENPTPKQKSEAEQKQQQQMMPPPMPGGGMPGGPQMGGMPQGGGQMPIPQQQGGGPGFFGRLGNALRMPPAQGDVPQDAPFMQWMQQQQQANQQKMAQQQAMAKILDTLAHSPTDSPEFLDAATRGEVLGITKGIPDLLRDDIARKKLAKDLGISEQAVGERLAAAAIGTDPVTMTKLMTSLQGKVPDEALPEIKKSIMGGKAPDAELFAGVPEATSLITPDKAYAEWNRLLPGQPKQITALLATLESAGNFQAVDEFMKQMPPTTAELEALYAANREDRAERSEAREDRRMGMAESAEGRSEARFDDYLSDRANEREASLIWAASNQNLAEAKKIVAKFGDRAKRLNLNDILERKSRGGGLIAMPMAPGE